MTRSGTLDDTSGSSEAPTAAAAAEALMGASGRASTNAAFRSSVLDKSASAGLVPPPAAVAAPSTADASSKDSITLGDHALAFSAALVAAAAAAAADVASREGSSVGGEGIRKKKGPPFAECVCEICSAASARVDEGVSFASRSPSVRSDRGALANRGATSLSFSLAVCSLFFSSTFFLTSVHRALAFACERGRGRMGGPARRFRMFSCRTVACSCSHSVDECSRDASQCVR